MVTLSDEFKETSNEKFSETDGKTIYDFLDKFTADDYKHFIDQFKEIAKETRHARLTETKTLSQPVFLLIAIIFVSITTLAWKGTIEGHYVTSVGGVIVGYMLSFLEVSVKPREVE